jgi:small subunit ribosomal protein S1
MDQFEDAIGEEMLPTGESDAQEEHPMDALLEAEAYEIKAPRRGEIRKGTIARVSETDILVDIGAKSEGVIPTREIENLTPEQREEFIVGAEIDVYVVRNLDRDGTVLLSLSRAAEEQEWVDVEELRESREVFEGTIAGYNKGGLIVKVGNLRGFIPASQVSVSRRRRAEGETPDDRWGGMVDEAIVVKVIEVDRRRNRLILSERAAAREARDVMKERLISELQVGEERSGHVISLADFGAFVDIGGADGLIHISELSWKRISHPSEVVKVGQEVQVKVLGVDPEKKRISLSLRELESDPWDNIIGEYKEGQLVEGTITKLTKFGAFAYLKGTEEYEIEGLIHISELSDRRIEHPKEIVEEGQTLTLRMINIDQQRRRIGLSLKQVDSSQFADLDWQTAMQEREEGPEDGEMEQAVEEPVDFDAALEEELAATGPVDELETEEDESAEEVLEETASEIDKEPVSEVAEDAIEAEEELAVADSMDELETEEDESAEEVLEETASEIDEEPVSEVAEDAIEAEEELAVADSMDELETEEDESAEEALEETASEIDEEPVSEAAEDAIEAEEELAVADSMDELETEEDESAEEALEETTSEIDEEPVSEVVEDVIEAEQEPDSDEVEPDAEESPQSEIEIDAGETPEDTDEGAEDDQQESDAPEEPVVEESDTDEKS